MRPIVPLTAGFAAGAVIVALLDPAVRGPAWWTLAIAYVSIAAWGSVSLASGIFGKAIVCGRREGREVAITFDDGPDGASTPVLLDLLESRGVATTFFCVGARVERHPHLVRRCHDEGHLLGNHSHRHSPFTNLLWARALRRDLEACQTAIRNAAGVAPRYYRPPFGLMNHAVDSVIRCLGLRLVGWDVRSLDTTSIEVDAVIERILRRARPGSIILLHDGGQDAERVVEITRRLLDALEERKLAPVRLDRLVG